MEPVRFIGFIVRRRRLQGDPPGHVAESLFQIVGQIFTGQPFQRIQAQATQHGQPVSEQLFEQDQLIADHARVSEGGLVGGVVLHGKYCALRNRPCMCDMTPIRVRNRPHPGPSPETNATGSHNNTRIARVRIAGRHRPAWGFKQPCSYTYNAPMNQAIVFDTHRFVERLTENGFSKQQAEVLADEQVNLLNGNPATKTDLSQVEARLKGESFAG